MLTEVLPWVLVAGVSPVVSSIYVLSITYLGHTSKLFGETVQRYSWIITQVPLITIAGLLYYVAPISIPIDITPTDVLFVALGAVMYGFDTVVKRAWTGKEIDRNNQDTTRMKAALLAPVPEEIVYRAGLRPLTAVAGPVGYICFSAVLFGFAHYTHGRQEVLFKALNGVVYGTVYLVAGTLAAPVLAHFGYNAVSFYVSVEYFGQTDETGAVND